jgi:superfamily II DNA or RNA helicase
MDDNCSEVLQKKRRLEKEILGESDDDKEYVSDFLFRLPATPREIAQIADKARSNIESIHKAISEGGYDAYIKLRSSSYEDKCNPDSHETIDSVEDTTDALEEESIVRGDPRWYQTAMFELAKSRNTIVTLETGKGKTLIALLLIRHLSHTFQEGKRTLFLVPSVALATQHATTIRANLPYTVATASYNSARKPGAKEAMATANILVATHGAMLDLFMHYGDLFQMHTINLLIVDECHYARGDHGYVQIMKNFYYPLDAHARPRVLGLVSSLLF